MSAASHASLAVCTIVARNYLAHARVLARSVREQQPSAAFFVLVIDPDPGHSDADDDLWTVVDPAQLPTGVEPARFRFQYDVVELSTAYKPFFMAWLLREHRVEKLLFLDPDIAVYAPLDPVYTLLDEHPILVTPHATEDFPADGKRPSDSTVLLNGVYNLGFLGVRAGDAADRFLAWFQGKLAYSCVKDYANGYYVDQRYIDFARTLFPELGVTAHPGCNTAFWNLHCRRLEQADGVWRCNGEPLIFYHFSGFDPDDPRRVSRNCTRYGPDDRPEMHPLLAGYAARLHAEGYAQASQRPYGLGSFDDGTPIPYGIRFRYRRGDTAFRVGGDPSRSGRLRRIARLYRLREAIRRFCRK